MPRFTLSTAAVALALSLVPFSAVAQDREFAFSITGGAAVLPEYFGSDNYEVRPSGRLGFTGLRFGNLQIGDPDAAPYLVTGSGLWPSLRLIRKREGEGDLAGLDDVKLSIEAGVRLRHTTETWQVFTDVRYGAIGHNAVAGEVGADLIYRGPGGLIVNAGPRAEFGNGRFMRTYFGVTDIEAARAPAFDSAYTPSGGIYSYGVQVSAYQPFATHWGVSGRLRFDRLQGDAADSPITQQRDQFSAQIGLTRHFNLRF